MITGIVLAAAVTFCAVNPTELRCTDAPVVTSEITGGQRARLEVLAAQVRIGSGRYSSEGASDEWEAAGPGQPADCEDRLLWAGRELEAIGLGGSYRFVAVEQGIIGYRGARPIRQMHLVLVIEGQGERLVLDTQYRRLRLWSDYDQHRAYAAQAGIGGEWAPYS